MKKLNQQGFGLTGVLVLLFVVGVMAFASYRIYVTQQQDGEPTTTQTNELSGIESAESIDAADKELDAAEADSGPDENQLDGDTNALL